MNDKYIVTQEHIDSNPFFASLNVPVGTEVEYDPSVVISREEAIARGIDVEAVEAGAESADTVADTANADTEVKADEEVDAGAEKPEDGEGEQATA
jgi:hypothetical protein